MITKRKTHPSSASELRIEVRSVQDTKFQPRVVEIPAQALSHKPSKCCTRIENRYSDTAWWRTWNEMRYVKLFIRYLRENEREVSRQKGCRRRRENCTLFIGAERRMNRSHGASRPLITTTICADPTPKAPPWTTYWIPSLERGGNSRTD